MKTQKEKILKLLQDNPTGINSFGMARDLALQLPTRIWELKRLGHNITSTDKQDGSVDYILQEGPPPDKFEGMIFKDPITGQQI